MNRHCSNLWFTMLVTGAALVGCTQPNPGYDPDPSLPGDCRRGEEATETFSAFGRPNKLDALFIVDTSGGEVSGLQEVLANAVSRFGELLRASNVDARMAVATTSASGTVALAGPSKAGPGCEDNENVIADLKDATWATTLRCNLLLGPLGEGFDEPLLVLDDLLAAGAGTEFFRDDARLLVIVASKDDDCSSVGELDGSPADGCASAEGELLDVEELVDGWRSTREELDGIGFAVLGGAPSGVSASEGRPVCSSTVGSIRPANRLFRATQAFGEQGFFYSACTDDAVPPLVAVIEEFVADATVTFCLESESLQEPLSVLGSNEETEEPIRSGEDGFTYLSSTEACPTGAIRFAGRALRGVDEVEIDYCVSSTSE